MGSVFEEDAREGRLQHRRVVDGPCLDAHPNNLNVHDAPMFGEAQSGPSFR